MASTHFGSLVSKKQTVASGLVGTPSDPREGDFFFDNLNSRWAVYYNNQWWYQSATTTTSTSSSTTTTSTSTTTTSTSTSTTTSTSTSTSTSTTTTV